MQLLHQMNDYCLSRKIPFSVLVLFRNESDVIDRVVADGTIPVFDASAISADYFPIDGHPNARWHRAVAWSLSACPEFCKLYGLPTPSAVRPPDPYPWRLRIDWGGSARLEFNQKGLRVVDLRPISSESRSIELVRSHLSVMKGEKIALTFKAKAVAPRSMTIMLLDIQPKSTWNIVKPITVKISSSWKSYALQIIPEKDSKNALFSIDLGMDKSDIDFQDLALTNADGPMPAIVGPIVPHNIRSIHRDR
jgi:hypothetical protein